MENSMNLSIQKSNPAVKTRTTTKEIVVFSMLGAVMFCSKIIMEFLPNVHLLGMFTMVYTIVYRRKALFPIYVYVLLNGIFAGFSMWWIPYLYIWTILWAVTMLLPRKMSVKAAAIVYPLICGLHGLCFGIMYAPAQALMFGFNFEQMIAWIIAGIPWDVVQGIGNFAAGFLIIPLVKFFRKVESYTYL